MPRNREVDNQVAEILYFKTLQRRLSVNLKKNGPALINSALERMSLRALAKRVDLSPTYLSRVANNHANLSKEAFLRIAKELR